MAPWPEQGSEPKAPDKEEKRELIDIVQTVNTEDSSENSVACRSEQISKQAEEKEVLTLDEGQLRALLDEAITYKNPKDREGKSELFKELLQEVEADENNSKGLGSSLSAKLPRSCYNLPVRRRHPRHQGRECGVGVSTTRGGSLQNLHALGMGGGRRRSGRSGETLVSARQREGGSLPTNVNVDNETDLDSIICPNYTSRATLEVSGSCKDDNGIIEDSNNLALFQGNCVPSGTEHLQHGSNYNASTRSLGQNSSKDDDSDNKFASTMTLNIPFENQNDDSCEEPLEVKSKDKKKLLTMENEFVKEETSSKENEKKRHKKNEKSKKKDELDNVHLQRDEDEIPEPIVKDHCCLMCVMMDVGCETCTRCNRPPTIFNDKRRDNIFLIFYNLSLYFFHLHSDKYSAVEINRLVKICKRYAKQFKVYVKKHAGYKIVFHENQDNTVSNLVFSIACKFKYEFENVEDWWVEALTKLSNRKDIFDQITFYKPSEKFSAFINLTYFKPNNDLVKKSCDQRKKSFNQGKKRSNQGKKSCDQGKKRGDEKKRCSLENFSKREQVNIFLKMLKLLNMERRTSLFFKSETCGGIPDNQVVVTEDEFGLNQFYLEDNIRDQASQIPPPEAAGEEYGCYVEQDEISNSQGVCPLESGPVSYPANPVPQHVSMFNIPPPQIQIGPDEHRNWDSTEHKKVNVNRRGHQKAVAPSLPDVDSQDSTDKGVLGSPFTAHWNRYSSFTFLDFRDPSTRMSTFGKDGDTKTRSWDVDQNQNSVGCLRMDSNCMDRKKTRRVKTKNDRNYILAENIEGFRGGADIDTLMEYIESPSNMLDMNKASKARTNQSNGPRNHVKVRAKEEDSRPIKRRTKEKFQRCNSLEEISKTKLEDLTEESSSERVNGSQQTLSQMQVTLDDTQISKKSTWGDEKNVEESSTVMKRTKELNKDRNSPDAIQDSEFHVVTKKQRKKKRRTGCSGRIGGSKQTYYSGRGFPAHDRTLEQGGTSGLLYQYRSRGEKDNTQPRRKSASSVPPSDKSDSSDLDSVHSLPVSSTTSRTKVGKNSISGGSTPQASYADIARTMTSPPDIDHGKYSPYLSGTGADLDESSSDHPEPSVTLPTAISLKKDAMTDTNCDIKKPPLHKEEYPPLDIKTADIFLDPSIKPRNTSSRDNIAFEIHTKTILYVIPISESGTGPRSTSVHMPSASIKPLTESDCKRPPVILMDEPMANSQIPSELTFGFEVNQQLLQCEETVCSLNSVASQQASYNDTQQTFPADSYWGRVIAYLTTAWEETMRDLQLGRAKYYEGQ